MFSNLAMTALGGVEFLLATLIAVLFWKKGFAARFPAMAAYLYLRAVVAPVFSVLLWATQHFHASQWYVAYFFLYWPVYIVSTLFLYSVCAEVFRSALEALPGLKKLGLVIFRWTALVSVIISFSQFPWAQGGAILLPNIAIRMMRSISILELCLLGFLCLCMNSLRMSIRDMAFGIAAGLGLMAMNDFFASALALRYGSLVASWQFVFETATLGVLVIWIVYTLTPQPKRKPVMVPANSPIYRWNEIASALGYTGTQVAVQQPSDGFFLTDVENVVEKVLARNLKDRESES
jgi:hypothetical protein